MFSVRVCLFFGNYPNDTDSIGVMEAWVGQLFFYSSAGQLFYLKKFQALTPGYQMLHLLEVGMGMVNFTGIATSTEKIMP